MAYVSVVTPVYNTAEYLAECITSVLSQTRGDFEYLIVDNASTDGSGEIAEEFAKHDARIRVVHFEKHLPQIPNYNRALRLTEPTARFCKIAQADDVLLPRCLEDMLSVAETDHGITLVGAYCILQNYVFLDGLDFYERVIDGVELCRRYMLGGPFIFGNPTSHLYRMIDIQESPNFYSESSPIADADAAVRLLLRGKFGFVHQTLSFSRRTNDSISTRNKDYDIDTLTRRMILEMYGGYCLDSSTLKTLRRRWSGRHNRVLAEGWLFRYGHPFWDLHSAGLAEAGLKISWFRVFGAFLVVVLRYFANLEGTIRRLAAWFRIK